MNHESQREVIDFSNPEFCAKCGRRWGDHLTEYALQKNQFACRFVRKDGSTSRYINQTKSN